MAELERDKVNDQQLELLVELYRHGAGFSRGISAKMFRKDHPEGIEGLDYLEWSNLLERDATNGEYRIKFSALLYLPADVLEPFFADLDAAYGFFHSAYMANFDSPIQLDMVHENLARSVNSPEECIACLKEPGLISVQIPKDGNPEVCPDERLMPHGSFREFFEWYRSLGDKPEKKENKNVEVNAKKRERILGTALAVLAANPDECKYGGVISGERLARLVVKHSGQWISEVGAVPEYRSIARIINIYQ